MKILYLITKSNWGGAQRHVYDLAVAMKARGHDVSVALGGNGMLKTHLENAGIFTHPINTLGRDISTGKDAGSLKEIMAIIRHRKPDILHVHSPKAAGLGSVAGRLLRVPSIVHTVHGWAFNEDRSFVQRGSIAFFSWLTMIFCHTTILLSEREYIQALHFPWVKKKLLLISPGIRPPIFLSIDGAKQLIAKHIGMNVAEFGKKTVIGTIAELHPNKGLTYLINAFIPILEQFPQTALVIIGDGQDRTSLENLIRSKNLEGHVFLAGYIDQAAEYIKAFTVFALSSIKEGMPYAILEAGAANVAVVATTVGGIPELVEDMRSGVLVRPRNVRELSHAISFMVEHPDERRKYATALKERVLTEFSIDSMVAKVEELYTSGKV